MQNDNRIYYLNFLELSISWTLQHQQETSQLRSQQTNFNGKIGSTQNKKWRFIGTVLGT